LVTLEIEHDVHCGKVWHCQHFSNSLCSRAVTGVRHDSPDAERHDSPQHSLVIRCYYYFTGNTKAQRPPSSPADQWFTLDMAEGLFRKSGRADAGRDDCQDAHSAT
jgi:hypothetical protein